MYAARRTSTASRWPSTRSSTAAASSAAAAARRAVGTSGGLLGMGLVMGLLGGLLRVMWLSGFDERTAGAPARHDPGDLDQLARAGARGLAVEAGRQPQSAVELARALQQQPRRLGVVAE